MFSYFLHFPPKRSRYHHHYSALSWALDKKDVFLAKFYVKTVLLNNHYCLIDFHMYIRPNPDNIDLIDELYNYQKSCLLEIQRLESIRVFKNITVFDYVDLRDSEIVRPIYNREDILSNADIKKTFPIYQDVILAALGLSEERAKLLNQLKDIQLGSNVLGENGKRRMIFLPSHCLQLIAEYLSNNHLQHFVDALIGR